jgi:hypothetical protein
MIAFAWLFGSSNRSNRDTDDDNQVVEAPYQYQDCTSFAEKLVWVQSTRGQNKLAVLPVLNEFYKNGRLYTIMKNTFITNYQRMVRRGTFVDTTDNLHYLNSSDALIDNGVFGNFTMDDIQQAIQKLDEVYRTPFLMHFRGFKYHEIAEKLQIPIGTVKNRIHIARKLLKEDLMVYKHKN